MLVLISLVIGTVGFHVLSGQLWIDALLNAAMLLGGMGPVGDLGQTSGKLFASFYALYSGLVFLIVAGLLFMPVFHLSCTVSTWTPGAISRARISSFTVRCRRDDPAFERR